MSSSDKPTMQHSLESLIRLARVWQKRGKIDLAANYYRQILAIQPGNQYIWLELVMLLQNQNDWTAVVAECRAWLTLFPANDVHSYSNDVHKLHIDALVQQGGLEAAYAAYQLEQTDERPIEIGPDELLCCVVVRNEAARLPYFLNYYRRQGVAKFLIVDNDSTDGTAGYLAEQPDVYAWHTPSSYHQANCGTAWLELLLRCYGVERWVVLVDADELLYFPACETRTLADLCGELESAGKSAYKALLVEMYGDKPLTETHYEKGTDFLATCPYLDRQYYHLKTPESGPFDNQVNYHGGMRARVFGGSKQNYILNKIPLFKYRIDDVLPSGQHWLKRCSHELSSQRGALLHFKYFAALSSQADQEIVRGEYPAHGSSYREYAQRIAADAALTFYDPLHSVRFEESKQLVKLGIMRDGDHDQVDYDVIINADFPPVPSVPQIMKRPFWSIMLVADEGSQALSRAVESIVTQVPPTVDVQVEVIYDRTSSTIGETVEATVRQIGDPRVQICASPRYLGYPGILTLCVERAQGHWVHILGANDWLEPNFYSALQTGIDEHPEIGAAFCRFDSGSPETSGEHAERLMAPLESATAGILTGWLARVAVQPRVAYSAMVVRRGAYEQVGGFCLTARTASKWEMCQRLACHFPIWYEPQILAHTANGPDNRQSRYGQHLADALAAIAVAQSYLPTSLGAELANKARVAVAQQTITVADEFLQQQDYVAALAHLGEGLPAGLTLPQELSRDLILLFKQIVC